MARFKVMIADTVTYARMCEIEIEAVSERAATMIAERMTVTCAYPRCVTSGQAPGAIIEFDEDQVDNTPWEIEVTKANKPELPNQ